MHYCTLIYVKQNLRQTLHNYEDYSNNLRIRIFSTRYLLEIFKLGYNKCGGGSEII